MSDERFTSNGRWIAEGTIVDICDNGKVIMQVFDDDNIQNVVDLLNTQQATIIKQKEEIKKLKRTERSWRRIHCCNKESDNCGIVIEQEATIKELKEENKQLREEWEFSFRTEMAHHRFAEKELQEKIREKQATIEHLKERLYDFEKRKIIEESEIDEDVIPKIKLLRSELFGEKYE